MGQYFDFRPGYLEEFKPGDNPGRGQGKAGGGGGGDMGLGQKKDNQWYKLGRSIRHPIQSVKEQYVDPAQKAFSAFKEGLQSGTYLGAPGAEAAGIGAAGAGAGAGAADAAGAAADFGGELLAGTTAAEAAAAAQAAQAGLASSAAGAGAGAGAGATGAALAGAAW
jgi:hypothetical protein